MKSYEVKIYSRLGKFKKSINPKDILSEISFSEDLNGGQWSLNLEISGNIENFEVSDIVEIREVSENSTKIIPTFTGIIEEIQVEEFETYDKISLEILGLHTLLGDFLYRENNQRKFQKNGNIANIFREIIDHFNTEYWDFSATETQNLGKKIFHYSDESIENFVKNITLEIDNTTHLEAMNKITEISDYVFFIDATGLVTAKPKNNFEQKILTLGREVISFSQKIKKRDMCNSYIIDVDKVGSRTYNDQNSIQKYGKKEKVDSSSDIKTEPAMNDKWNEFIRENANPKSEISLILKPQNSDFLYPWTRITLQNIRNPLSEKQITKIDKNRDNWTIYIGDYVSFGKILSKN